MKHITAVTIRCASEKCGELYQIPVSANESRAGFEIDFAICPYCRHARNAELLLKHWGERRCWGCHVPFSIKKENGGGLCNSCYLVLMKQKNDYLPKRDTLLKMRISIQLG